MTTPLPPDQLPIETLLAAWSTQVATLRLRLVELIREAWQAVRTYRDPGADEFVETVVPLVLAAQSQTQLLTEAYLAQWALQEFGLEPVPLDPLAYGDLRLGTSPDDVYRRPFIQVRADLSRGAPLDEAVTGAEERAAKLVETDIQLAKTNTAQRSLMEIQDSADQRLWYERTLTGPENCALCVVASTQRYHVADLLPIHPGCDCGIRSHSTPDPGPHINDERLEELHSKLNQDLGVSDRGGRRVDYRKIITVREHGEYGPLLGLNRHEFTGPEDVPAPR